MLEMRGDIPDSDTAVENMEISFTNWLRERDLSNEPLVFFEESTFEDWDNAIAFDLFPRYRAQVTREIRFVDRGYGVEQGIPEGWDWSFFVIDNG